MLQPNQKVHYLNKLNCDYTILNLNFATIKEIDTDDFEGWNISDKFHK